MAASVAGASHDARGEACQDAHAAAELPAGGLALAVADGAGSAPLAGLGARIACDVAVAALAAGPGGDLGAALAAAAGAARAALRREADARGAPLRDLACTLTAARVDAGRAAVLQVGDGLAVLRVAMDYEPLVLAVAPARGEHANETAFLTGDGALDRPAIAALDVAVDAVALSTDGLLRLAVDLRAGEPHAAFFAPLLAFAARDGRDAGAAGLAAFLRGPRVRARTDDDATLVLAVRSAPGGA